MNLKFRAINEKFIDSITGTGTVVYTNEKNMYLVKSDNSKMKITDVIFIETDEDIENIEGKYLNKVYIAKNNQRMYTWNGTEFLLLSGGGGAGGSVGSTRETVQTAEGQTSIEVPFKYTLGNILKVFKNGVLLDFSEYSEVDNTHINVITPCKSTDKFTFVMEVAGNVLDIKAKPYYSELVYNEQGNIQKEIYTGQIEKTIEYIYDTNGNIKEKVVEKNGKKLKATYNYDEQGNLKSIYDEGTEILVIDSASVQGGGMTEEMEEIIKSLQLDSTVLNNRVNNLESEIDVVKGLIEDSKKITALNMIDVQLKYDNALSLKPNYTGDFYIDSLKYNDNIEEMINATFTANKVR